MKLMFVRHAEPDYKHDSLTLKGHREAQVNLEIVLIKNLEDAAFEVLRFRRGRQNRMVAPLRAVLDLSQLHMRIVRRIADNMHERIRQNVLRAGAGNQVAACLTIFIARRLISL